MGLVVSKSIVFKQNSLAFYSACMRWKCVLGHLVRAANFGSLDGVVRLRWKFLHGQLVSTANFRSWGHCEVLSKPKRSYIAQGIGSLQLACTKLEDWLLKFLMC